MAYAWLDGKLVRADEARVSLFDRGFLQGDGCFETIRIHRGAPFRFDAHVARLRRSLEILGLTASLSDAEFRQTARSVVEASGLQEGLVRITVTAGEEDRGPSVAVTSRPLPKAPSRARLIVAKSVRRAPGPLSQCKTISRAAESTALREAQRAGAFDAILLNPDDRVVESSARNVFAVVEGTMITPPIDEGALPGVTRAAVLELAAALRIRAEETPLRVETLMTAEEVFLSGTGVGILPVAQVDGHRYTARREALASRLKKQYAQLLDADSKW